MATGFECLQCSKTDNQTISVFNSYLEICHIILGIWWSRLSIIPAHFGVLYCSFTIHPACCLIIHFQALLSQFIHTLYMLLAPLKSHVKFKFSTSTFSIILSDNFQFLFQILCTRGYFLSNIFFIVFKTWSKFPSMEFLASFCWNIFFSNPKTRLTLTCVNKLIFSVIKKTNIG